MTNTELDSFNLQVSRFGFWSAVVVITTFALSLFLPLDVPEGYSATQAARVEWLVENRGLFIVGWLNQIVAMLSLSAVLFGLAWHVARKNLLVAILASIVVLLSVVAFIIPKFIAVWTIPQLATTIATHADGAEMAAQLLCLLNVSIPFSLYTSFDYLGFWLYAVFALLVAGPLYGEGVSSKLVAVTAGLFGLMFHGVLIALWVGSINSADLDAAFAGTFILILVLVVAMLLHFREDLKP